MKKEVVMMLISAKFNSEKEYEFRLREYGNMLTDEELKVVTEIADQAKKIINETGDVMSFNLMEAVKKHASVFGFEEEEV